MKNKLKYMEKLIIRVLKITIRKKLHPEKEGLIKIAHKDLQIQLKELFKDNKRVLKLKMNTGETVEAMLKSQAKLLLDILQEEIERFYLMPEGWYKRSNNLRNSIDKSISIDPRTNTITLGFLDNMAWHDSWITKTYDSSYKKEAYVSQGVRKGYEVFNTGHYIDGHDYLQCAVNRFDRVKKPWITVKIEDNIGDNWWK